MSHAPFPYYGGKNSQASDVWSAFGSPDVYSEPFAGSLAVLLARPAPAPGKREVVCDTDGHIVNFWRALRDAPDEVAYWADYPTFHDDLTARHSWLVATQAERGPQLQEDPNWYDAKAAGWWVWGISNWIGGGWCSSSARWGQMPRAINGPGGSGVQPDRVSLPGDQGLFIQRALDGRPLQVGGIGSGGRLLPWFHSLAQRLARVTVLNRDWTRAVTPAVLMDTPARSGFVQAVFLDPPYLFVGRHKAIYVSDASGETPAQAAYDWAVAHGARYRVAYCAHADDFPLPDGWWAKESRLTARKRDVRNETIYFSPACLQTHQSTML